MGFDSMNKYYDVKLKRARLKLLKNIKSFLLQKIRLKTKNFNSFNIKI